MANSTFNRSWLTIGLGVLALLALLIFFRINPEGNTFFLKCPLHQHTGIYCAGCGSQRAIHDLLHGRVGQAADHNLLLILASIALIQHYVIKLRKGGSSWIEHQKAPWITLILVLVFMLLRNLPLEALEYLKP